MIWEIYLGNKSRRDNVCDKRDSVGRIWSILCWLQIMETMEKIKVEDLSVGDWVRWTVYNITYDICISQITDILVRGVHDSIEYGMMITQLSPIPITAEILENNGFTLCEDCSSRWKKEFSYCCVFVTAPEGYASVTVYERVAHGHRRVIDDLQLNGVHQLQRVLRLAKVGKEIVL